MKLMTGLELMELGRSMEDLKHLAEGDIPCRKCNATGWHKKGVQMETKESEVLSLAGEIVQFVKAKTNDGLIGRAALETAGHIFGVMETPTTELEMTASEATARGR